MNTAALIRSIQIGLGSDVPLHEGGTGPDEPVWYFDSDEQFNLAVRGAEELGVGYNVADVHELPEDEIVTDAEEFLEYVRLQA